MQTRAPLFEDLAKAMEGAMGLANAAGTEARTLVRAQGDRLVAEFDLVRRDELEAQLLALRAELASLRAEVARLSSDAAAGAARASHDVG
jgi:BMFP domain-containing protein YqiC